MEELNNQEGSSNPEQEEFELSHTDKLVGVFSAPGGTFEKMSKFPAKTGDWFIPLAIVIVAAILSYIVMMSNPVIKQAAMQKQIAEIEKRLDDMVKSGQLTEAQKDQQMEVMYERMDQMGGVTYIIVVISIILFSFISFFIIAAVLFVAAKFILKGQGTYKDAMVAYGLPYYILVIQIIVMVILALAMGRLFQSTSVAAFMEADITTFTGFILNKLDVFSIWFYATISISFAKMFKSDNTTKYFVTVFGIWIGFGIILFYLAKAFPLLRSFGL